MMFFPSLSSAFKASMRDYRTSRPLSPCGQLRESRRFPLEDQHSFCKRRTWRDRVQRAVNGIWGLLTRECLTLRRFSGPPFWAETGNRRGSHLSKMSPWPQEAFYDLGSDNTGLKQQKKVSLSSSAVPWERAACACYAGTWRVQSLSLEKWA